MTETADTAEESPELALLKALEVENVVVIHADTLRSDHLPMYGYDRMTAPNLDRDDGMVIAGYEAMASWTLPSTTTALLGLSPEHHGNVNVRGADNASAATSFGEYLQANGFATAAYSGSRVIASDPALAEGFDVALDVEDLEDAEAQAMSSLWTGAEGWLDSLDADQPFFLWLQPMDTHPPYRPVAPFRGTWADYSVLPMDLSDGSIPQLESFIAAYNSAATDEERAALVQAVRDIYDELILQEDDSVGKLFAWLEENGHAEDTLVVLTADHGETLSDDGMPSIAHGATLRPELLRVPMVLYHPSLTAVPLTCLSSNTDLLPTVVRALGLPPIPDIDGQALQEGCRPLVFASLYDASTGMNEVSQMSATDGTYKLDWNCLARSASYYDLSQDKAAVHPIEYDQVPNADQLWKGLADHLAEAVAMDPHLSCDVPNPAEKPLSP